MLLVLSIISVILVLWVILLSIDIKHLKKEVGALQKYDESVRDLMIQARILVPGDIQGKNEINKKLVDLLK